MLIRFQSFLIKIIWSCAPIIWGLFTWFMAFGKGSSSIASTYYSYQYNLAIRALIGFSVIILFFGKSFNSAQFNNTPFWFNKKLYLLPWRILVATVLFVIGMSFFFVPLWKYEAINSLVLGVMLSSCIEELVTHSIFVKYHMDGPQFIIFNVITSISFALMHKGYVPNFDISLNRLTDHILFSFFMGTLAYETKRIEVPIICHMLSNLSYTFIGIILGK